MVDYKEAILSQLEDLYRQKGPDNFLNGMSLACRNPADPLYAVALNQLITEEQILAVRSSPKGDVALAINPKHPNRFQKPSTTYNTQVYGERNAVAVGNSNTVHVWNSESRGLADPEQLARRVQELERAVQELAARLPTDEAQAEVRAQLDLLVMQTKKENPNRQMAEVTGKGLIEAAKTVAEMSGPITTAVAALLALLH
jgi:hypothetical protein